MVAVFFAPSPFQLFLKLYGLPQQITAQFLLLVEL
ncbi:Hypothetical protein Minf_0860 [Methylacidiphilum infernorum V4]|uniref:Uncharacterized protein n=1 Tax=Methylacidiphilum infernorum (isolate V4) TaxID=481448 RepID=B3E1B9_METI4|nr:Hypothetical protein Minf_0860 [Methylacidiphilum infernorum V4]